MCIHSTQSMNILYGEHYRHKIQSRETKNYKIINTHLDNHGNKDNYTKIMWMFRGDKCFVVLIP